MIGCRFDGRAVDRALARLPDGVPVAMRELKKPLRADQTDHAKAQAGPDGAWPKRATLAQRAAGKRKRRRRRTPRRLLGRLPLALRVTSDRRSVTVASRVKYSLVHQEGGKVGRGARLPARPFLWVSERMMRTAIETLQQEMVQSFAGASR